MERQKKELKKMDSTRTPAVEVGKVVYEALTAEKPASMYRVGKMSTLSHIMEFFHMTLLNTCSLRNGSYKHFRFETLYNTINTKNLQLSPIR